METVDQPNSEVPSNVPSLETNHQIIERSLANKYGDNPKFIPEGEVKKDAMTYVASALGSLELEILLNPYDADPDRFKVLALERNELVTAIEIAGRNKDLSGIQAYISGRASQNKEASRTAGLEDNIGEGLENLSKALASLQPTTPTRSPSLN